MTCETDRKVSRARLVSIRWSDSGVVIRMSGGLRTSLCRSADGVSPLRTATAIGARGVPSRSERAEDPSKGLVEVPRDVLVQGLQRRDVKDPNPARPLGTRQRWSRQARNAASVLPDPVGAKIRVFRPDAIDGQPSRCGGVGCP